LGLEKDMDQSKPTPNDSTVSKQSLNLIGVRIGHHVEIFWNPSEEEVADASTHEVGEVPVSMEAVQDLQGLFIDHLSGDGMFRPGDDEREVSLRLLLHRLETEPLTVRHRFLLDQE
jgi:hypothetical protein